MQRINLIGPLKIFHQNLNFYLETLFVDGGIKHKSLFKKKLFSIGDQDSSSKELDIKLDKEKDRSDTHYALNIALEAYSELNLHGFYGGRLDHQLALLGDILEVLKLYPNKLIKLYTHQNSYIYFSSRASTILNIRGEFSVFSTENQDIYFKNAKYPLNKEQKVTFIGLNSLGLSNFTDKRIEIHHTKPILIIPSSTLV